MSNSVRERTRTDEWPGRVVVSTASYDDAAEAINWLAEREFPVERATIVARGLRLVEHVVGRRGVLQAAGEGALTGAAIGGMIGLVFGLFTVAEAGLGLGLLLWGVLTGAIVGALLALVVRAFLQGRRFDSFTSVESERYDVIVDESVADEAERVLGEWTLGGRGRRLHRRSAASERADEVRHAR